MAYSITNTDGLVAITTIQVIDPSTYSVDLIGQKMPCNYGPSYCQKMQLGYWKILQVKLHQVRTKLSSTIMV